MREACACSRSAAPARDQLGIHSPRARRSRAAHRRRLAPGARRRGAALGRDRAQSRSSSRNSACASPSRSSARPLSSSGRCSRRARTCCRRVDRGIRAPAQPARRRCRSRSPAGHRAVARPPHAEVFVDLERAPAAAASIAQVHRARLANGAPSPEGPPPGHRSQGRGRPAPARRSRAAVRSEVPEARATSRSRGRRVRPLDDARARSRDRGAQHRALCAQLPRRAARADPAGLPAVDQRGDERAGAHRRHPRRDRGGVERAGLDRKAARRARRGQRAQDDSRATASSTPIRTRAT